MQLVDLSKGYGNFYAPAFTVRLAGADVVRELSDRIVVLHNGALVADGEPVAGDDAEAAWWGTAAEAAQSAFPLVRELVAIRAPHRHQDAEEPAALAVDVYRASDVERCRGDTDRITVGEIAN